MLASILRSLNGVYDLELDVDVHDYLVSDRACALLGQDRHRPSVLVRQDASADEVEVGLYIEEKALARLAEIDLAAPMRPESFALVMTACEEVSHLAYLLFCASRDKRVTQLELELQAEVDKFIIATLIMTTAERDVPPSALLAWLFGGFVLRAGLDEKTSERYNHASSLGVRYCSNVLGSSAGARGVSENRAELRHFYRLSQRGKIGRILESVYAG